MEHAKLIVHRGATRVTRGQLVDFETPPATATWKPIPHATLVSAIHEELAHRNITIVKEDYAVQRKNHMLFGTRSCTRSLLIIPMPRKPGKMVPYHHHVWGSCHGTTPRLLSTGDPGPDLVVRHAAPPLAEPTPWDAHETS